MSDMPKEMWVRKTLSGATFTSSARHFPTDTKYVRADTHSEALEALNHLEHAVSGEECEPYIMGDIAKIKKALGGYE